VSGLQLAALSEVLARHCTNLDADSAFIAGLLNRIGVLYIFTKYTEYPSLLQDPKARQNLIDEWAAPIGESIVQNWKFSAEIQATLNPDEVETTRRRTEPNLADIIIAAKLALNGGGQEFELQETRETQRLQLTPEQMPGIVGSYKEKLNSLSAAVS
jgi:HD-like signal output (HDOD) protein